MTGPEQPTAAPLAIPPAEEASTPVISAETAQLVPLPTPETPAKPTLLVLKDKRAVPRTLDEVRIDRQVIQGRQGELERQRKSAVEELQKVQAAIETATLDGQQAKVTTLHTKRRSLEDRLSNLAGQGEVLSRHLEGLSQEEQKLRTEEVAAARRQIQQNGRLTSAKLHGALSVAAMLFGELMELGERDRINMDMLRSVAPQRMTECPTFWSYEGSGVDTSLRAVVGQVLSELPRWTKELQRREQARVAGPSGSLPHA